LSTQQTITKRIEPFANSKGSTTAWKRPVPSPGTIMSHWWSPDAKGGDADVQVPLPVLVPILVAGGWLLIVQLTSLISGWASLARSYRYSGQAPLEKWRFQSAQMRYWTNLQHAVTIGASPEGLYLAACGPLRLGFPPLLIPWSHVSVQHYWLPGVVELRFAQEPSIPIRIRTKLVQRLDDSSGGRWPKATS